MRIFLLATLLFLSLLSFIGVRFYFLLQKSKQLVRAAVPFEQEGDANHRVLFAGDSTAVGVGSESPRTSVAGHFGADFLDRTIKNLSRSGRKTRELIPILQSENEKSTEWVFIQIGGNDILYFTPEEKLRSDIDQVLREAGRVGSHVVLLTSGNVGTAPFFPKWLGGFWTRKTLSVREIFSEKATEYGVIYVDLFEERENDPFLRDITRFYSIDLLHPSGDGYGYWYDRMRETIRKEGLEGVL